MVVLFGIVVTGTMVVVDGRIELVVVRGGKLVVVVFGMVLVVNGTVEVVG